MKQNLPGRDILCYLLEKVFKFYFFLKIRRYEIESGNKIKFVSQGDGGLNISGNLRKFKIDETHRVSFNLISPLRAYFCCFIFITFAIPGFVYGRVAGTMKNDKDIINAMSKSMGSMGLYITLVFFAAQFVAFFKWTNLGTVLAGLSVNAWITHRAGILSIFQSHDSIIFHNFLGF